MKNLMKKVLQKSKASKLAKQISNERGQGMLEYILLVVILVGIIVVTKPFLEEKVGEVREKLSSAISGVTGG